MTGDSQKQTWRKSRMAAGLATAIGFILVGGWVFGPRFFREEYASFISPDGNYRIVVLREPVWPAVMP
ncbi:MAG: hypothetical protein ACRET3_07170, partial [Burkholderiales bacterium]